MLLDDAKVSMNIDFDDQDGYIGLLVASCYGKAKSVSGLELAEATLKTDYPEIYMAIISDVQRNYQERGESITHSESSLASYRRYCKKPMF